jgi:amino acid adenylation domain-containing protein
LVFEEEQLSYGELNERSNQLAHYLQGLGVKEETLVPICIERGIDMMVGVLGVLKAGGAYVPVDTDFPADRIRYMLEDTRAAVVLCSSNSSSKLDTAAEIVELDTLRYTISKQPKNNLTIKVKAAQLAYLIYTSGSTGTPKGVMITHRSLVDYVYGLKEKLAVEDCASYALVSTLATDLGNTVVFSSLLLGGALHVFAKESVSNAVYLHEYFSKHRIDCLKIVASHWRALSMEEKLLLPVKLLIFGGEALQSGLIETIHLSGTNCQVVNHYGPTETTIGKLLHLVDWNRQYGATIPIGKPFSNTRVYVLSKELQLCPVGVPGQLVYRR